MVLSLVDMVLLLAWLQVNGDASEGASAHYGSDWKHMHAWREGALGHLLSSVHTQLGGGEQVFLCNSKSQSFCDS